MFREIKLKNGKKSVTREGFNEDSLNQIFSEDMQIVNEGDARYFYVPEVSVFEQMTIFCE